MNLTEIKNATRMELLDYIESFGVDTNPAASVKTLRLQAMDCYWASNNNEGFSYETVEVNY
jgi:hypothetical protein